MPDSLSLPLSSNQVYHLPLENKIFSSMFSFHIWQIIIFGTLPTMSTFPASSSVQSSLLILSMPFLTNSGWCSIPTTNELFAPSFEVIARAKHAVKYPDPAPTSKILQSECNLSSKRSSANACCNLIRRKPVKVWEFQFS